MNKTKQDAHALLESIIHLCARSSKPHRGYIDISAGDLARELGFSGQTTAGVLRIRLQAQFLDQDELNYERETGITVQNKTRN